MIELNSGNCIFKVKNIFFSDFPYNVNDCNLLRFYNCKNEVDLTGFRKHSVTFMLIDLTQELNVIWENMSKSSCRYAINKAIRDGVSIKTNENYESFIKINDDFRKNKKYYRFPSDIDYIKKNYTLFTSMHNGEVLSGQLYIEDLNNILLFVGAYRKYHVDTAKAALIANSDKLMIWEAIKYSKIKGIRRFHLGEYQLVDDPECHFLKCFRGELVTFFNYEKNYSGIYELAQNVHRKIPKVIRKNKVFSRWIYLR